VGFGDSLRDVSDVGLVALALNVDNKEAARILADFGGVRGLALAPPMALCRPAFSASIELARRACLPADPETTPVVNGPKSAAALLVPALRWAECEELHALFLAANGAVIEAARLGVGSTRFCIIDPGVILRRALLVRASAMILAHNHPSGSPEPSNQDVSSTRRVADLATPLGIRLLDHIVVGRGDPGWASLAEADLMPVELSNEPMYLNR
jgi:DNA repair protein RadC